VSDLPYYQDWPRIASAIPRRPVIEERVESILGQMTLEEKLGQMIQPELGQLTAEDVTKFKIGSALNGAGIWPGRDRHASVAAWVETVDAFWEAAALAYRDRPFQVPFMWATDAVHGHNNVYQGTIYPHNIGLGAARNPELMRRMGAATAREIAVTGMDWTFAPTVTTPRNRRWGRYYEGYSEDPALVYSYAGQMVEGLQGGEAGLRTDSHVIATVKHWVADGATVDGADRGTARCSEDHIRNIHAAGFYSALAAGAQCVMVSFSAWEHRANYDHSPGGAPLTAAGDRAPYNYKLHGSRYLITDVLKEATGFDGIVISDWDAHAEVSRCTPGDAGYAINAGLDVLMVAGRDAWQSVYLTAAQQVAAGVIPMSRIDDAVRRMLRVKMRAGLWDKPRPRDRSLAGQASLLGCAEHQELSRQAARESMVLLKNARHTLPLARSARVLATGSGVADISKQTGGWTLNWQGDDIRANDLPGCTTLAQAIAGVTGPERCTVDPSLEHCDPRAFDVAVVVIGEDSYAEMRGTIKPWRSVAYAELKGSYARDLAILRRLRSSGIPVVTVMLTGRPLYVTEEINLSDAFAVAWLPGPHGTALTDVLFQAAPGQRSHEIGGRLPSSWPRRRSTAAVNRVPPHIPDYMVPAEEEAPEGADAPLFGVGYGLRYGEADPLADRELPLDPPPVLPAPPLPRASLPVSAPALAGERFRFHIAGQHTWTPVEISLTDPTDTLVLRAEPLGPPGHPDGLALRFKAFGFPSFVYARSSTGIPEDLRGYAELSGLLALEVRVTEYPERALYLAVHDDFPAQPGHDISGRIAALPLGEWSALAVPLHELVAIGSDLRHVDVPFMLYTEGQAALDIRQIRWELPG
jgi:beta-glucosidase